MNSNEALLVIDIDRGDMWQHKVGMLIEERKSVALNIIETLKTWRQVGGTIIFVVLVYSEKSQKTKKTAQLAEDEHSKCLACRLLPKGERLAGFLGHRHGENYEPVFLKEHNDAFTNSELISFLRSKGITRVFLAGCHTFACVLETARGALKNGINVTLLKNCVYRQPNQEEEKNWISEVAGFLPRPFGFSVSIE